MQLDPNVPAVIQLADEQLRCYNRRDLDGFCACYAPDVVVLDADGRVERSGAAAFREHYAVMFAQFASVRADIHGRLALGPHLVEHEVFRKTDHAGHVTTGAVLIRYTVRGDRIAVVQFLRQPQG